MMAADSSSSPDADSSSSPDADSSSSPAAAQLEAALSALAAEDGRGVLDRLGALARPEETLEACVGRLIELACEVSSAALESAEDDPRRALASRGLRSLHYLRQCAVAARMSDRALASEGDDKDDAALAAGLSMFSPVDLEDANGTQMLLLYLLNIAHSRGYRRRGDAMYERVARGDHDTHAWREAMSIRDFVYENTRKELNFGMWLKATAMRGGVATVVEHLTQCRDYQLPDLARDRRVFSFRDGVYLARTDEFARYGTDAHRRLPESLAAAKYFDADFGAAQETCEDTPSLQRILDFQDMPAEVCGWLFVLIGRLLYDVGDLDGWQVVPFLKGAAQSGKSTILTRVCRDFYDAADVGVLSNNIERKFGLSALYDKWMIIAPEIKSDVALEQAEFQSMVSGETVQVAIKCQTARTVEWVAPLIMAGNQVPGWVDNAGSVNRRIVLIEFPKMVTEADTQLGQKLRAELPRILVRCNRAYLAAVRDHGRRSIWTALPAPFHAAKREFAQSTNSVVGFIEGGGSLELGPGLYVPMDVFSAAYREYAELYGLRKERLTHDNLAIPLARAGCSLTSKAVREYPRGSGRLVSARFVVGCDTATGAGGAPGGAPGHDPLL
jgi:hypothetical protein